METIIPVSMNFHSLFMLRAILLMISFSCSVVIASAQSTPDLEATICIGDTATMSVSVSGADSLQWYHNGYPVLGANRDTLVTTRGGIYYLKAFHGQCYDVSGDIRIFTSYPRANDDYVRVPLGTLSTFNVLTNDDPNCAPFD